MAGKRPSDYRISKYRSYFKFLDVNDDSFIDDRDFELFSENMAQLTNTTPAELRKVWMDGWKQVCGQYHKKTLTIDEAVEIVIKFHMNFTVQELTEFNHNLYGKTFDAIDRNKDGKISLEELGIFYKSHGFLDDVFIKYVFEKIDKDNNNSISRNEFVNALISFWLCEEPENGFGFLFNPSTIQQ